MGKPVRSIVPELVYEEIEKIGQLEGRSVPEVGRLLLLTGLRVYRRKRSLRCGFEGCTRAGCCGGAGGLLVPFGVLPGGGVTPPTEGEE